MAGRTRHRDLMARHRQIGKPLYWLNLKFHVFLKRWKIRIILYGTILHPQVNIPNCIFHQLNEYDTVKFIYNLADYLIAY